MKILLVNDDGVDADGIRQLQNDLKDLAEITVVAPHVQRSSTGHAINLDSPIQIKKLADRTFSCDGYPADCALWALAHLLKNDPPDLVISGINDGGNLGQDVFYSGTVAGAREATFHGYPSIAISVTSEFGNTGNEEKYACFRTAAQIMRELIVGDLHRKLPQLACLNVNVPNVAIDKIKGVCYTVPGFRNYSKEVASYDGPRGKSYYWPAGKLQGFKDLDESVLSDCAAIEDNCVSISVLGLESLSQSCVDDFKKLITGLQEKIVI